ncbi:DUF1592 domain-containing protein [Bdellovibrio sp. HCB337]|uniref:DUF1592 domain-containing protein n=1 Tax=Bdellovibrio sp. HCB337 TaxID=3394358 RepID=UPI0039A76532
MGTFHFFKKYRQHILFYVLPSSLVLLFGFQNCGRGFSADEFSSTSLNSISGGISDKVCVSTSPVGQALVRKLNRAELNFSLQDLLEVTGDYTVGIAPDASDVSGFTNNAENLQLDSDYVYALMNMTEKAVGDALKKTNSPYLQCAAGQNAACAKQKLSELGKKAYRRPITTAEETLLMDIFNKSQAQSLSFQDSLGFAMQRVFMSPVFLYRSSYSGIVTARGVKLSSHELATRLAYFLWSSVPDAELLAAADSNQLSTPEQIQVQVKRLMASPKADRFIRNFTREWLGMQKLQAAVRTGLTDDLKKDMQEETERLMLAVAREDRSALDIINADFSYINANLATLYGISGVAGTDFRKVEFSPLQVPRRGLLTQGSLLTITSSPTETKPVARGSQILNGITCNPPPPFPDGLTVTPLADSPNSNLTITERMAEHRKVGTSCYNCHKEMDPVGLGLENYDQIGRFRTTYASSGNPVDATGSIRNVAFQGGMQLVDILAQQNDFKRCLTKKLMTYAIGRSMTTADQCAIQTIGDDFVAQKRTFSDLIAAIVMSEQFLYNQTSSRGE